MQENEKVSPSGKAFPHPAPRILLTGATGYIGGRLLRRLERQGFRVRCLARRPEALRGLAGPGTEVLAGDLLDPASLERGLKGIDAAFYLVHSLGTEGSFEARDRLAARNFARAAKAAGVGRIIYLGGLVGGEGSLSPHLRSRLEVGRILRETGVPVVEFRASVVIGSGSLSFELVRSLVERLPVMITPRWVRVKAQPIAIDDVLEYLVAALSLPPDLVSTYEIGGADQVTYADLMREYARQRGLRRWIIPVPVLSPFLSSLWLGLVTPLYARVGRRLIESISHPSVVRDPAAVRVFGLPAMGMREAMRLALAREDVEFAETHWSEALANLGKPQAWGGGRFGNRLVDSRLVRVASPPESAFATIQSIGGQTGWYAWNWLWHWRGRLDRMVGGVGMRRGRPDPSTLHVGDAVDFWRVEAFEANRRLRLAAEMKVPGRAWLEFEVTPNGSGASIRQTAIFDPKGALGRLYWYALFPLHQLVFRGMLRGIAGRVALSAP